MVSKFPTLAVVGLTASSLLFAGCGQAPPEGVTIATTPGSDQAADVEQVEANGRAPGIARELAPDAAPTDSPMNREGNAAGIDAAVPNIAQSIAGLDTPWTPRAIEPTPDELCSDTKRPSLDVPPATTYASSFENASGSQTLTARRLIFSDDTQAASFWLHVSRAAAKCDEVAQEGFETRRSILELHLDAETTATQLHLIELYDGEIRLASAWTSLALVDNTVIEVRQTDMTGAGDAPDDAVALLTAEVAALALEAS